MKVRIHKKLNEELISGIITIIIPIKIKIDTEDKNILTELNEVISIESINNAELTLNNDIISYIDDNKDIILKQLNIRDFNISDINIDADIYNSVPIISGIALFDFEVNEEVYRGMLKQTFNTLLNNNVIFKELTSTIEDDVYDIFDINITVEKDGDIEIGSY